MNRRKIGTFTACAAAALMVTSAAHANDWLIKFDDIEGGSERAGYEGWSFLTSFSGDVQENTCGQFVGNKFVDAASAELIEATIVGRVFDEVQIDNLGPNRDTGATELRVEIRMANAKITEVALTGGDGSPFEEQLVIQAEQITFDYVDEVDAVTVFCDFKAK